MALTQPSAQGTYGVLTQRGAAFLAPFTQTSDVRSGSENHIFGLKADQLRNPEPSLDGNSQ